MSLPKVKISISDAYFSDAQTMTDFFNRIGQKQTLKCTNESRPIQTPPSPEDKISEESWLQYLDRCAIKDGFERPNHLILLRKYGATTAHELSGEVGLSQ